MRILVLLIIFLGAFLVMDAVHDQRLKRATRETRSVKRVYVPLIDEQLSGRSLRDVVSNMFDSSGPWSFRDDAFGSLVPPRSAGLPDQAYDAPAVRPGAVSEGFGAKAAPAMVERRSAAERRKKRAEKKGPH